VVSHDMVVLYVGGGAVISTGRDNVSAPERCLSCSRLLAGMYKAEDDRVNCNTPTRAFPKFAYDQRKARRQ